MVKGERELDELCGVVLRKLADGGSEGVRICNGSWDWVLQAEEGEENAIFDLQTSYSEKGEICDFYF